MEKLTKELKKNKDIVAIYQFGSYGTKKYNPQLSDIDICVFTKSPLTKNKILNIYSSGTDKLDISIFDSLPIYVKPEVFKGKPLFIKDKYFIAKVFAQSLRSSWDYQKCQTLFWGNVKKRWVKNEKNKTIY